MQGKHNDLVVWITRCNGCRVSRVREQNSACSRAYCSNSTLTGTNSVFGQLYVPPAPFSHCSNSERNRSSNVKPRDVTVQSRSSESRRMHAATPGRPVAAGLTCVAPCPGSLLPRASRHVQRCSALLCALLHTTAQEQRNWIVNCRAFAVTA